LNHSIQLCSNFANSYSWRGNVYEALNRPEKAKQDYLAALAELEAIPADKLGKNSIRHLIRSSQGLQRLGENMQEKVNQYITLAKQRGFTIK
jgi:hypothetical protein